MHHRVFAPLAAGCALALAFAAPAVAEESAWRLCDGFYPATDRTDGMSEYISVPTSFDRGAAPSQRIGAGVGVAGVAGCDEALAQLPAAYWRRKANLLLARALHRIEAGAPETALADLDLAGEVGASPDADAQFARSQALGLSLTRAFVLKDMGRSEEVESLLQQAQDIRPFDRGVAAIISALADPTDETGPFAQAQARLIQLDPRQRAQHAEMLFDTGRFEEFLALLPYLSPPRLPPSGVYEDDGAVAERMLRDKEQAAQFQITAHLRQAYALAALGRYEESEAAIAAARQALNEGRTPPAAPGLRGDAARRYGVRLAAAQGRVTDRRADIDAMAQTAARRRQVAEGAGADLVEALMEAETKPNGGDADLLLALAAALPPERAQPVKARGLQMRNWLKFGHRRATVNVQELFRALPAAETPSRRPPMREADVNGFGYGHAVQPDGTVWVSFGGGQTSGSQVEELALLRAAELAKEGGHAGFVVLERTDVMYYTFGHQGGSPSFFQCSLKVRWVDSTPNELRLDADAILAALRTTYGSRGYSVR